MHFFRYYLDCCLYCSLLSLFLCPFLFFFPLFFFPLFCFFFFLFSALPLPCLLRIDVSSPSASSFSPVFLHYVFIAVSLIFKRIVCSSFNDCICVATTTHLPPSSIASPPFSSFCCRFFLFFLYFVFSIT
eukprot:GILI01010200.1.p1 GENE.GILI01010200.1~~GILI01010200.1.p1  ORF type:complete len:130 (-),score=1.62 GILI01010200.1:236-625(-)